MKLALGLRQIYQFSKAYADTALCYTKTHEWVQYLAAQRKARVGITTYAQQQLGEIIHLQMPTIGKTVSLNESTIVIESVKAAVDVYTPLAGKVIAINSEVEKDPTQISQSAETSWLFELSVAEEPKRLLSQEEYRKLLELT